MALIVETGAGLADAESYCSVSAADTHHAARGITNWATLSTEEKEQALRRATDYMGQVYRTRWRGWRTTATQALDWPRYDVPKYDTALGNLPAYYPQDAVPAEVVKACAELALRGAAGELDADMGQQITEQTVGPITTKYAAGSTSRKRYVAVDMLLSPLLADGAGVGTGVLRMVRA